MRKFLVSIAAMGRPSEGMMLYAGLSVSGKSSVEEESRRVGVVLKGSSTVESKVSAGALICEGLDGIWVREFRSSVEMQQYFETRVLKINLQKKYIFDQEEWGNLGLEIPEAWTDLWHKIFLLDILIP